MNPIPVLASVVVNALFALSVLVAAVLACLLAAARRRLHDTQPVQTMADFAEELLGRSARSRATLVKLATYQDAEELRDLALRETGQALGAVAVYLYRHRMDGTTPLVHSWFRTPEFDLLPKNAAERFGTPDYLDEHSEIRYVLGQQEGNNPAWDDALRRVRAHRFLAGLVRVDGEVWGHVGYLVDRPGAPGPAELEFFHGACALVQIGVLRAKILETRDTHQRQLVASARAANQAARAKTMFLATMSHEIRTPLNAVIGYSEFLNRPDVTPDEIREYTAGISHSANALLALINDILDLSKLEAGKVDMNGRCDLVKLFDELDSLFHYRAVTKDLRLAHTIRPDFPVLKLSEEHVRQILLNIVGNAVKFTDAGLVEWTAEAHEDGVGTVTLNIDVHDTGVGIPKDKLKTIFDPFVQDGATRGGKVYNGTGLGLPIVKRLLEACNGTIEMQSEPGEGTRVHIHVARVPVLPKDATPAPDPAFGGGALKLPEGFRAVIVDDVPINLKILDLHVKGLGVTDVARAASAEEALKAIAEKKPDVVLTDMWMPGMSGADLAVEIRKNKALDKVPLVAVTADNDVGATFDASLFAEILTKPVTAAKLKLAMMHLFPYAR
ncbi:MAG: response regulator [Kiritimatiellae bacterium]|nr:response regulator [Kiritimatiellia bacterium]